MPSSTLSLTSALYVSRRSTPSPGRFTPGKYPLPTVLEAGWAPGPVWTNTKNLASTGIRSRNRPVRCEFLYRLSYHGPAVPSSTLKNVWSEEQARTFTNSLRCVQRVPKLPKLICRVTSASADTSGENMPASLHRT